MGFGKSQPLQPIVLDTFPQAQWKLKEIRVVYSSYPNNQFFESLNQQRIRAVEKELPREFLPVPTIRLIRQTGAKDQKQAASLAHGVGLIFEPVLDSSTTIPNDRADSTQIESPTAAIPEQKNHAIHIDATQIGTDSTVLNVFERHQQDWKDSVVIITDLTYSMAPFTWQVLQWHQEIRKEKVVLGYVFFNDGAGKSDQAKKIGATGGVYITEAQQTDSLANLMSLVMAQGDGGDIPENDIEALLAAMNSFPHAQEYILIADTKSSIRDWPLLYKLNKPVRVILARATYSSSSIQPQYIDLALRHGGSLYSNYHSFTTPQQIKQLQAYFQEIKNEYDRARGKGKKRRKRKKRP